RKRALPPRASLSRSLSVLLGAQAGDAAGRMGTGGSRLPAAARAPFARLAQRLRRPVAVLTPYVTGKSLGGGRRASQNSLPSGSAPHPDLLAARREKECERAARTISIRHCERQRSNPGRLAWTLDCFVAIAPRNDEYRRTQMRCTSRLLAPARRRRADQRLEGERESGFQPTRERAAVGGKHAAANPGIIRQLRKSGDTAACCKSFF